MPNSKRTLDVTLNCLDMSARREILNLQHSWPNGVHLKSGECQTEVKQFRGRHADRGNNEMYTKYRHVLYNDGVLH